MAGRRLLDAARLLGASGAIAKQHLTIRAQQWELLTHSSGLAKAVKHQTDRVTLTARAAYALSRTLNGTSATTSKSTRPDAVKEQNFNQSTDPTESDASTIPTPDPSQSVETPGQDTFTSRPTEAWAEQESLPHTKIPNTVQDTQGSHEHVQDSRINQDVFYSTASETAQSVQPVQPPIPRQEAIPEQEQMLQGINTDVFHSPRVASLLSSRGTDDRKKAYELKMKAARKAPVQETIENKNADTFNTRKTAPVVEPTSNTTDKETQELADAMVADATAASESQPYQLRESAVPSSRFGRFWQYGGLATSMAFGAVGESLRRVTGGAAAAATGSLLLSPANMERLVVKLSRMRGAALKLGQMMSFQDSKMLPPAINAVLQRVQDSADYMPIWQRNQQLAANLGADWQNLFTTFQDVPMAAASIGQVHRATLASNGREVAVKIQYPGVRGSIDSDLSNLSLLLTASRLLPAGLFLDKTIANARTELGWECDYTREAECGVRFASLLQDEPDTFRVPEVFPEACGPEVLTAELMYGKAVTKIPDLSQDERDWIGTQILRLCLRELMEWRFMQTDPNWTNFLYSRGDNNTPRRLELLDFGASRDFPESFVTPYIKLLIAASTHDRTTCRDLSIKLGYLTGAESQAMLTAHVDSILTLAEPFDASRTSDHYDFRNQTITDRVREKIGLMVRERLAPPPEETYSLHRKLSGAFLLCARLGANVPAKRLFEDAVAKWEKKQAG
jgi:aarF domain-containing kinase